MLKQVWIDLLDNAIKFSPDVGRIDVTVSQDAEQTRASISNEGEAIAPEALAHIFDKFYQADTSRSTAGNGLGLAIVKRIVDLHKGGVEVASAHGTTNMTVCLPSPGPGK